MHTCPVCGYAKLEFPPEDFTICPSCGTEFGYQDASTSHQVLRQKWVSKGPVWHSVVVPQPPLWNGYLQLIKAHMFSAEDIPWLKGPVKVEIGETIRPSIERGILVSSHP